MIWSVKNLLPSSTETPSSASVGLDGSAFSMPAVSSDEFPHSSGAFKMKLGLVPTSNSAASMRLAGNCNTVSEIHDSCGEILHHHKLSLNHHHHKRSVC
jgi:hypothetical protein